MSVLQNFNAHLIQGGHVDELTLVGTVVLVVHPLNSVWVALSTAECVVEHWLISGDKTMLFIDTMKEGMVLIVNMWTVCL